MNKKMKTFISAGLAAFTSLAVLAPSFCTYSESNQNGTLVITEEDKAVLIGVDNPDDYFLGVASQFSVFVLEDFTAEGSDCEGRLAAGGSANLGKSTSSYSVAAKVINDVPDVAHVVIGGDTLQNFEPNKKNFVAPADAEIQTVIMNYMNNGSSKVYGGELFDFNAVFNMLNERSSYLAGLDTNTELEINNNYKQQWTIKGTDKNLNVLNLTDEQYAIFSNSANYIELTVEIPKDSYLAINIKGTKINLPSTNVTVKYDDGSSLSMVENMPILYNLPEATEFKYGGSIQGSTLAPKADASGDEGGHVSGMTIAKSFEGGIQFGYSTFNPSMDKLVALPDDDSNETTTTTNNTTTTTKATTTTTTITKTSTTKAATTTATTTKDPNSAVLPGDGTTTTTSKDPNTAVLPGDGTGTTTDTTSSTLSGETTTTTDENNTTTTTTETTTTTKATTTKKSTTTKSSKSTTTTAKAGGNSSTTSDSGSPKTGDAGAGAMIALTAVAIGAAFVLRKKED